MSDRRAATVAVFLNYRTADDTVLAVRSLQVSTERVSEIIVVDNASGDGSAVQLATTLPGTRLLEMTSNGGFSAGCNVGIREALALGADRVLLLNSDVFVPPDAVGNLSRALDADPRLGVVGPVLVSKEDPEQIQSMGMRYSSRSGRMRHYGYGTGLSALAPFGRLEVDGVSGCAMLVKREVFERVGLLAEEYFFGFEDLDFCLRARASGFRSACVGTAVVQHEGHLSIGRASGRRIYFATRNHLLLARRCAGSLPASARWLRTPAILGFNLAHVLFTSDVPLLDGLGGFLMGMRDHFAGRYGPGPRDPT